MATQFNNWEPRLDGLEGNFQAEPRVFAHDAKKVTIGAINSTATDGGFSFTGGNSYLVGETLTAASGGATFTVTSISAGVITGLSIVNIGSGYTAGTPVNLNGGSGSLATFTPTNINIPNTSKRGCCLYIGGAGTNGVAVIKMESGNTAVFKGLAAGSFIPVLAVELLTTDGTDTTDVTDVLSLY